MQINTKFEAGQSIYYILRDRLANGKPWFVFGPRKIEYIKAYIDKDGQDIYNCFYMESYDDEKVTEVDELNSFLSREDAERTCSERNKKQ